jgi:hypothetical protein
MTNLALHLRYITHLATKKTKKMIIAYSEFGTTWLIGIQEMNINQIHTCIFWLIVLDLPVFKMMQNPKIARKAIKNLVKFFKWFLIYATRCVHNKMITTCPLGCLKRLLNLEYS